MRPLLFDHTIDAGNTDSASIVRVPDLEDGGHIIEVVARGYRAYFGNFNSGANVHQLCLPYGVPCNSVPRQRTAAGEGRAL